MNRLHSNRKVKTTNLWQCEINADAEMENNFHCIKTEMNQQCVLMWSNIPLLYKCADGLADGWKCVWYQMDAAVN